MRTDLVIAQFGDLLQGLKLPTYWREIVRESMLEAAKKTGLDLEAMEREKERLRLKRGRILKQHREGYIDDEEFEGEMAAVELALKALYSFHVKMLCYFAMQRANKPTLSYEHIISFLKEY